MTDPLVPLPAAAPDPAIPTVSPPGGAGVGGFTWRRRIRWEWFVVIALPVVILLSGLWLERNNRDDAICESVSGNRRVLIQLIDPDEDGEFDPILVPANADGALRTLIEETNVRGAANFDRAMRLLSVEAC